MVNKTPWQDPHDNNCGVGVHLLKVCHNVSNAAHDTDCSPAEDMSQATTTELLRAAIDAGAISCSLSDCHQAMHCQKGCGVPSLAQTAVGPPAIWVTGSVVIVPSSHMKSRPTGKPSTPNPWACFVSMPKSILLALL